MLKHVARASGQAVPNLLGSARSLLVFVQVLTALQPTR